MTMKSKYIALAMMGAMMSFTAQTNEPTAREFEPPKPPKKVIPKGCKEYHFTRSGNQVGESCSYIHFSCIASSERKAKLKFEKYLRLTGS